MTRLGRMIRRTRLQRGLRAYELAAQAAISPTTLSLIERRGMLPSEAQLLRLIRILDLPEKNALRFARIEHTSARAR